MLQALGEASYSIQHAKEDILQDASQSLMPEILKKGSRQSTQHYMPRGIVAVITPWNFPVNLSLNALIPLIRK